MRSMKPYPLMKPLLDGSDDQNEILYVLCLSCGDIDTQRCDGERRRELAAVKAFFEQ